jgi:hypothetical protein
LKEGLCGPSGGLRPFCLLFPGPRIKGKVVGEEVNPLVTEQQSASLHACTWGVRDSSPLLCPSVMARLTLQGATGRRFQGLGAGDPKPVPR